MISVPLHAEPQNGPGPLRLALNVIGFQLAWFACVIAAARDLSLAGVLFAAAVISMHFALSARPHREAALVAGAVAIGIVWDGALGALGWVTYAGATSAWAPVWILVLWALFATTLNVSLRWLQARPMVAALLGAVAGPLSYWGAQQLGACRLVQPTAALVALALGWAVFTPLLAALARRLDNAEAAPRRGGRRG